MVSLQKLKRNMNTLQLNIEKRQFFDMLQTLNVSDKWEMYKAIKKSLLCDRMENVLNSLDINELSMEDITETVEEVRQKKYEKSLKYA